MEKAGGQGEAVEMEKPGGQGEAAGLDKTGDDKAVRLFNTKKSFLIIGPDTAFIMMGSFFAIMARYYIY